MVDVLMCFLRMWALYVCTEVGRPDSFGRPRVRGVPTPLRVLLFCWPSPLDSFVEHVHSSNDVASQLGIKIVNVFAPSNSCSLLHSWRFGVYLNHIVPNPPPIPITPVVCNLALTAFH